MTETQRAKELVDAHWDGYVGLLVAMHSEKRTYSHEEMLKLCAWHYKSAGRHFYGHACEDVANGLFRPRIGEVTQYAPAHPYFHLKDLTDGPLKNVSDGLHNSPLSPSEVKEIAESVAPSLCATCAEPCSPRGDVPAGGYCHAYKPILPPPSDEWESKAAPLSLSLPSITVEGDLKEVYAKLKEEQAEWTDTEDGSMAELVEAWDVIQVAQTYKERGGGEITRTLPNMELYHQHDPERTEAAKRAMIIKNAARAMYAPEVCEKIVMSGGREW